MAGEVQYTYATGRTTYFLVRNAVGQIWNGSAFESYLTANYTTYDIAASEQGTASKYYVGTFPSSISPGVYSIEAREQLGGTVAESDPVVAVGELHWNGSATVPRSDLATSGQVGQALPIVMARGRMVPYFLFDLVSAADHVTPFTSGVVSGQIARDNGSFGALQSGAFTEVGLGFYRLQAFTSGDLLANTAAVVLTANGVSGGTSDPRRFSFVLQRTSGQ